MVVVSDARFSFSVSLRDMEGIPPLVTSSIPGESLGQARDRRELLFNFWRMHNIIRLNQTVR